MGALKDPAPCSIRTTCPYCGVGCGVLADVADGEVRHVRGDPAHPANLGRLCVKGSALRETLDGHGRLLRPRLLGEDVDWKTALSWTAGKLRETVRRHGPDSVGFYLSGQLLTEDYYVANKLMKGFIGSANVDTNSRLCMASATAAHKRAFGEDLVPGCYQDLEEAELILLVGSNTAYAHPIVYQRIAAARERNADLRVVVLDPRRTATCEIADLHLALRPGSDACFFNGLLAWLADHDGLDRAFIETHCAGFDDTLAQARVQGGLADTARLCDLDEARLRECYELFASRGKVVTLFSQGINQSSSGTDKGNAIINCHLASGKLGRPGAAPFSITGQPNAMGGREVGGLANQLAAHMHFENPDQVALVERFWRAPRMARRQGLKAVEMFDAVRRGEIKALWIMATNPAVSLPQADKVREALANCELVIVSECFSETDTLDYAHVALPAAGWSEKTGTVTNSERCVSLQRALRAPPGEAWPDWKIVSSVARRMGFGEAFNFHHPADIFSEHAALSGYGNHGTRGFDISALAGISKRGYEALAPVQWPINAAHPKGTRRLFEDGHFFHPDGRARLVPIVPRLPAAQAETGHFVLNNGRARDQWHSMTRTGRVPRLLAHLAEPTLDIHPLDAAALELADGALAQLSNPNGRLLARVRHDGGQRRGELFMPIHWNDQFSSLARVSSLVDAVVDPISGQPEFKQCAVEVTRFAAAWSGVLLSVEPRVSRAPDCEYWTRVPLENGGRYFLAGRGDLPGRDWLRACFPHVDDWVELKDSTGDCCRVAGFHDDVLQVALLCETGSRFVGDNAWLEKQLGQACEGAARFLLLAGNGLAEDTGPIICACFQVGRKSIESAIREARCDSVEALGQQLRCGTNCGSCIPELKALLK